MRQEDADAAVPLEDPVLPMPSPRKWRYRGRGPSSLDQDVSASACGGSGLIQCADCGCDLQAPLLFGQALSALEERLQAELERHTERLIAVVRDHGALRGELHGGASTQALGFRSEGRKASDCSLHGVGRWQADRDDARQSDIIVTPHVDTSKSHVIVVPDRVRWQWQSTAGPWKDYEDSAHQRIEDAFRRGQTHLRLKSGIDGKVPMEVYFVNMVQRDPESRRVRRVRRLGPPLSRWELVLRHGRAFARWMTTGKPMYESLEAYRIRQNHLQGGPDELVSGLGKSGVAVSAELGEARPGKLRDTCDQVVHSIAFTAMGLFVLLAQCWWIAYSMDASIGVHLYQQGVLANILEHSFCVYFAVELAVQICALRHRWYWYLEPWLCLDAVCVVSSVLDVLVLAPLSFALDWSLSFASGGQVLRTVRLVKVFRIGRIFGHSHNFNAIFKGMVSGMRSAAFILALLALAVFTFAVLMRANSEHELLEPFFGTLPKACLTLLTRGLFLDGIRQLIVDLVESQLELPLVFFGFFMYVSFFGLMGMLVGAFCSVADTVHKEEEDRTMTKRIRSSLQEIVDCYTDNDNGQVIVSETMFKLLMRNPDVYALMRSCQTDIPGLVSVMNALFASSKNGVPFSDMLDLIVHLRSGKPSTVSDVAHLEGFVLRSFERLESLILSGKPTAYQSEVASFGAMATDDMSATGQKSMQDACGN